METTVTTEAGKTITVEWEPYPLAVALGAEWEWRQQTEKERVRLNHPSGLWIRLVAEFAYEEEGPVVTVMAGALNAAVEAGVTGLSTITMRRDDLEDGSGYTLVGWVERDGIDRDLPTKAGDIGPAVKVFVAAPPKVEDVSEWTDEQLLARHALLMTEAEELRRTDGTPSRVSVEMARVIEDALEAKGHEWDLAGGWVLEDPDKQVHQLPDDALLDPE